MQYLDTNKNGVLELEEVEDVAEEAGACLGSSLLSALVNFLFGSCLKKRDKIP